jgi:hypothetical protein
MKTSETTEPVAIAPAWLTALETAYGPPSQAGFGSAVFQAALPETESLESAALAKYRFFVGDLWDRYGEAAWMSPWQLVHARPAGATADIVKELRAITDPAAQLSAPLLLDCLENAEAARAALSAAYDAPAVTELQIFTIGDGAALSGLLIAGRRPAAGEATFLIFLMD